MKNIFTILVPIQKPELANALLPPAIRAANVYAGHIILFSIINESDSRSTEAQARKNRESLLKTCKQRLDKGGCSSDIQIITANDVVSAIYQAAQAAKAKLIVMGSNDSSDIFKNEIPMRLQKLPCRILTARQPTESIFKRLFVFIDDLYHITEILEYARLLLPDSGGLLHVIYDFKGAYLHEETRKLTAQIELFKRSMKNSFKISCSHFKGSSFNGSNNFFNHDHGVGKTCIVIRYKGNWLQQLLTMHVNDPNNIARASGLPIYLFKPEAC